MRKMFFVNFWFLTVSTSLLVSCLNPFIRLWLGKDMLFNNFEMAVVVSSFYFSCIRDPVQIFVSSYGLFKESKHLPILRACANLVFSIVFAAKMGMSGIFLGTTLSTVLVPLFGEVSVLYKYGFRMKAKRFYSELVKSVGISILCASVSFLLTFGMRVTVFGVAARAVASFCISNVILLVLSSDNPSFSEILGVLKRILPSAGIKKSKL